MHQKSAKESLNYFKVLSLSSATSQIPLNRVIKSHLLRKVETLAAEFESENQTTTTTSGKHMAFDSSQIKARKSTAENNQPMDVVTDID